MDNLLINFEGNEQTLKLLLENYMEEADIDKFVNFISKKNFYNGIDRIVTRSAYSSPPPGMMGLMIAEKQYNINLTKSALILLSVIIDIKLKVPLVSTGMALAGVNAKTIAKLDERKGEKCIACEVMANGRKMFNKSMFNNKGQCINNNFQLCKYKNSDLCTISNDDIDDVLNNLIKKSVIKKDGDFYKYII